MNIVSITMVMLTMFIVISHSFLCLLFAYLCRSLKGKIALKSGRKLHF